MSSILRKVENMAHPERREQYDATVPGNSTVVDPSIPRTGPMAHGGAGPAGVGTHAVGSEYTTTSHPHPHNHIASDQGKHGYIQYGQSPASGPAPTTAGPHRHDFMNKLDPRVDSTADHRPVVANTKGHNSKIANILDPRVDSSVANHPNVATTGMTHSHAGVTPAVGAGFASHEPVGHHQGIGKHAGTHSGMATGMHQPVDPTGPATHTAGPHRSNLLNKLDPTADSQTGAVKGAAGSNGMYPTGPGGTTRY